MPLLNLCNLLVVYLLRIDCLYLADLLVVLGLLCGYYVFANCWVCCCYGGLINLLACLIALT